MLMTKALFRFVLLVPAIAIILGVWIMFFGDKSSWPDAARQYFEWYVAQPLTPYEFWRSKIGLLGLLGTLVSTLGIVLFWSPARYIYVASAVVIVIANVPEAPVVVGGWVPFFDDVAQIFIGVSVALMFSEPAASWFA